MTVLIPTVRHSGSHLALDTFTEAGFEQITLKAFKPGTKNVMMDHVLYTKVDKLLDIAAKAVVVIPIRHPLVVALSWQRNGEELSPDFYQTWEDLMKFTALPGALLLPLDLPNVDEYCDAIEKVTKVRPNAKVIVGSRNGTAGMSHDSAGMSELKELDAVKRFCDRLPLIQELYHQEAPDAQEAEVEQEESTAEAPTKKTRSSTARKKVTVTAKQDTDTGVPQVGEGE